MRGECHALVGRNGAGKSTLVGVLTGLLKPDAGTVRLEGEPAPSPGDRAAWQRSVACVYQRSMVVPTLTVAENVFLNRSRGRFVSWRGMRREARSLMLEWGFDLDVDLLAADLSVEQRQIVEIARALSIGARFLILDEPTASLEATAIARLFDHVRRLKSTGVGILYISHHLEEVYEICDRATVLRDGKLVVSSPVAELDHDRLVAAMVGASVERVQTTAAGDPASEAPARLSVSGLSLRSLSGSIEDATFEIRVGECLGLFGLRGSGTTTIADVVAGFIRPDAGRILVDGELLHPGRVDASLRRGIGYVPEDRHARGFVPTLGVHENLTLPVLDRISRFGVVSAARRAATGKGLVSRLQIVSSGADQPVGELSGGNQQKVVVGRALASDPSLLVVVSPTVGVDVASKEALLGVVEQARATAWRSCWSPTIWTNCASARACSCWCAVAVVREFREPPWDRVELIGAAEGLAA